MGPKGLIRFYFYRKFTTFTTFTSDPMGWLSELIEQREHIRFSIQSLDHLVYCENE